MDESIDLNYTDEIVCPYCGYKFTDSWEIRMNEHGDIGKHECERCGKKFKAYRNIEITYTTEKLSD